jgi:hypothetical protein
LENPSEARAAAPPAESSTAPRPRVRLQEQVDSEVRAAAGLDAPMTTFERVRDRVGGFLKKHGHKLWWVHSAYALSLGVFVVTFAQKGFHRARFLAISLVLAWFGIFFFFRLYGSGKARSGAQSFNTRDKLRFLVMTYVLKNLYQSMLFFLLPFYYKAMTFDSSNKWFVIFLGLCAILSTVDIVFDHYLMRWRAAATGFYGLTLFASLNLVIPALLPNTRTLWTLLSAAGITVLAFWFFHVPVTALKDHRHKGILAGSVLAGIAVAYFARAAIPPVPMHVAHGAVGPSQLADGRLAMEVRSLDRSVIRQLLAVTDVVLPGGHGDRLRHVWRHNGVEVSHALEGTSRVPGPRGTVRLRSSLAGHDLPGQLVGPWSVDVETEDGQLVGRVAFTVTE